MLWRGCTAAAGNSNLARFQLDEFDRIYERGQVLPDGPERAALFREAQAHRRGLHAVQDQRAPHPHRLAYPWVTGFRRRCSAASGGTWSM
jgi:hypothetical protein